MLSTTIMGLVIFWIVALLFSITLGGWIHLLPAAAAPLLLARLTRRAAPASLEYTRWMNKRARRGRRA